MSSSTTAVPALAADVVLREVADGEYVVKHRKTRSYFRVGEVEHFLFTHLDGQTSRRELRTAFEQQFAEKLSDGELDEFLQMARSQGLLQGSVADGSATTADEAEDDDFGSPRKQSWLYFRVRLFDPRPVLNVVEPLIRWVWSPTF